MSRLAGNATGTTALAHWQQKSLLAIVAIFSLLLFFHLFHPTTSFAAGIEIPALRLNLDDIKGPQQISGVLQIIFLLTILSVAPAILVLMTSFTRLAIVLSFLRHALGTQQSPPNQIIIGLSLFLTFFIMQPTWKKIHQEEIVPYQ
jgi:flagellar biosynthesis protein FliP